LEAHLVIGPMSIPGGL